MLAFGGQSLFTERSPWHHKNEYINRYWKLLKLRMESPLEGIMVLLSQMVFMLWDLQPYLHTVKPTESDGNAAFFPCHSQSRSSEWRSMPTSARCCCAACAHTWCTERDNVFCRISDETAADIRRGLRLSHRGQSHRYSGSWWTWVS